jgi:hypothetical protein
MRFRSAIGRVRIVPEPRKVCREREDPRTGIGVDGHAVRMPLPFIDLLCLGDLVQRAIPGNQVGPSSTGLDCIDTRFAAGVSSKMTFMIAQAPATNRVVMSPKGGNDFVRT